jgi:hypothetical protein
MKKSTLLVAILLLNIASCFSINAANVDINSTNFPDANFRNYVSTVFAHSNSGYFTPAEIANITAINCLSKSIADLKGIENFTALTKLSCGDNHLTTLDVSRNTALTYLNCYGNQISTLDVSQNTVLSELQCFNNSLTSLTLPNSSALTMLLCNDNQLTDLNVGQNTGLTNLQCFNNKLTKLDVSKNTALTTLLCNDNQLASLTLPNTTTLTKLWCETNQLTSLVVTHNTSLIELDCSDNQLTTLDLSLNTALTSLNYYLNSLASINLSNNPNLTQVEGFDNYRTISAYPYTKPESKGGGTGYYVPLTAQSATVVNNTTYGATKALATLIDEAGQSGDPHFDLTKVVPNTWSGATLSSYKGTQILLLDESDPALFTYQYNTDFTGTCTEWYSYTDVDKTSVIAPNAYFTLLWVPDGIITGVDGVKSNEVSVYTTAGTINVGGSFEGAVDVYNLAGQQVYCGNDSEIEVPAGMYIVKVNGKAQKVLVK